MVSEIDEMTACSIKLRGNIDGNKENAKNSAPVTKPTLDTFKLNIFEYFGFDLIVTLVFT